MRRDYETIRFYVETHRPDEAIRYVSELLASDAEDADHWILHALALHLARRNEEALRSAQKSLSIDPHAASRYDLLSMILRALDRIPEALEANQQSLQRDPDNAEYHARRASLLGSLGQKEEGLREANVAVYLDPENRDARFERGWALAGLQRTADAVVEAEALLKIAPQWSKAHLLRGMLHFFEGEVSAARRSLRESLRLDPEDQAAQELLRMTQSGMGRRMRVIEACLDFLKRIAPYRRYILVGFVAVTVGLAFVEGAYAIYWAIMGIPVLLLGAIMALWIAQPLKDLASFVVRFGKTFHTPREIYSGCLVFALTLSAALTLPLTLLNWQMLVLPYCGCLLACVGRTVFEAKGWRSGTLGLIVAGLYVTQPAVVAAVYMLLGLLRVPLSPWLYIAATFAWFLACTYSWRLGARWSSDRFARSTTTAEQLSPSLRPASAP